MAYISCVDRRFNPEFARRVGPQTPCCMRCNGMLGDKVFSTFLERCDFVSERIRKAAFKKSARWGPEIERLQGNLRNYVVLRQRERAALLESSHWFRSDWFYFNLDNSLEQGRLKRDSPLYHDAYFKFFRSTLAAITRCFDARAARARRAQGYY